MASLVQASANDALDVLLEELCFELGLTRTQHERAARAYQSVGDWVSNDERALKNLRPRVFPHGSIPLGTAVRPRDTDQFDADGVCLLRGGNGLTPSDAYELVYARIAEHETYRPRLKREPRCIRVEYEDAMHLDIIPAIPASSGILIPSADRTRWQSTDPEGYRWWFDSVAKPTRLTLDRRAEAEPMPQFADAGTQPVLKRIVQLIKRRREVAISDDQLKPKSILLTTLAARQWGRQPLASDGLLGVLSCLASAHSIGSVPTVVPNPTNMGENLARHWLEIPFAYSEFTEFVADFASRMEQLVRLQGADAIAKALEALFDPSGSGVVTMAYSRYTERFQRDRAGSLIRAAGSGAAVARAIPRNQFFGR